MLTLKEAVELFLGEQIPSTRKSYYYNLRDMLAFCGEGRPLDQVHSEDLIKFGQYYRSKPEVKSPATFNKCVKTVRTFFNWCVKVVDGFEKSPATGLKRLKQKIAVDREKDMPENAFAQLVDFSKWDSRSHALVLFLGDTGCRIGGAAGLKWSDVEFVHSRARVTEKGTPERPVFFGPLAEKALLRWQQSQQRTRTGGDYVFSTDGHRMTNDSLGQFFTRLCARAGIGTYGPHSLRHRKGHQLADARVAVTTAAMLLGHSSPTITLEHYYPHDWDRVQAAALQLSSEGEKLPMVQPRDAGKNRRTVS